MPPQAIIPAVIAAVGAAATGATLAGALAIGALSLALSGLSLVMAPKPKGASFASIKETGLTQQYRQPVAARQIVYGEVRVSGPVLFLGSSEENEYLHLVIALASHEVEAIDEIIIDETSIPNDHLDGDGTVNTGLYEDIVRIKKHTGTTTQTADSDLVSEVTEWTSDHTLSEIAYIYVRLKWDREKFPAGVPKISAWVRGKKCIDPRDIELSEERETEASEQRLTEAGEVRVTEQGDVNTLPAYTPNAAIMTMDHLLDAKFGLGVPVNLTDLDGDALVAATNSCDEMVNTKNINVTITSADASGDVLTIDDDTLVLFRGDKVTVVSSDIGGVTAGSSYYVIPYQRQGTPRIQLADSLDEAIAGTVVNITSDGTATVTKVQEPRYHGGGVLRADADRADNIEELLSGMGGALVRSGGLWYLQALEYQTPTVTYDESDFAGPISVQTKNSKKVRFNQVNGIFLSQVNKNNPTHYPMVSSSTYITEDGEEIHQPLDLPFTQRPNTAQRIAKIWLERSRQDISFTADFKLSGLKVRAGDNLMLDFDRYGWSSKVFEVKEWELTLSDEGSPIVRMTCVENASSVYDFTSATEEATFDPAPNTNLPDAFTVVVPTGLGLDSVPVGTVGGDTIYKIDATWSDHDNFYVKSGGEFEVQFKLSSDTEWTGVIKISGDANAANIFQAVQDTNYDVRIRAINSLNVPSAWVTIEDFTVGSSSAATSEDWENVTEARHPDDWENDSGASSEDWEA